MEIVPIPDSVRFAPEHTEVNPGRVNSSDNFLVHFLISIGITITVVIYYECRLANLRDKRN